MFVNEDLEVIHPQNWIHEGVQYPSRIFREWPDSKLSSMGIYRVRYIDLPVPDGKYISGYTYEIKGNVAEATPIFEDIPVVIPERVSKAQGKATLMLAGHWDDVLDYVDTLSGVDKMIADLALNDTMEWKRDSPFLKKAALELEISEEQLDDLFLQASKIEI